MYPKQNRLLSAADYKFAARTANRLTGKFLIVSIKRSDIGPKVGIVVTRKYGNAVHRNLFKRRLRSIVFDWLTINSSEEVLLVIRPKPEARKASYLELKTDFLQLLSRQ